MVADHVSNWYFFINFSVSFAECIGDNEKILRAHSTVSKRVRTVVQEKIPKVKFEGLAQFHGHFPQQLLKISFKSYCKSRHVLAWAGFIAIVCWVWIRVAFKYVKSCLNHDISCNHNTHSFKASNVAGMFSSCLFRCQLILRSLQRKIFHVSAHLHV